MYNPFKFSYRITEYTNAKGETVFEARYFADFLYLINWFFMEDTYVNQWGELSFCEERGQYKTLGAAKKMIEKHKAKLVDIEQSKYKKSAIHYV